jgi:hypothetical protein
MKNLEQLQEEFEAIIYNNAKHLPTVEWEKPLNWFRLDYLREISIKAFSSIKEYLILPKLVNEFIELTTPYPGRQVLCRFIKDNTPGLKKFDGLLWDYLRAVWCNKVPSPDARRGLPKSELITINLDIKYGQKYHLDNYILPEDSFWNPQDLIDFGFRKINNKELNEYSKDQIYLKGGLAVNKNWAYFAELNSWCPVASINHEELNKLYHPIKWIKDPRTQEKDLTVVYKEYNKYKEELLEREAQEALRPKRSVAPVEVEDLHVYSRGGWDGLWWGD